MLQDATCIEGVKSDGGDQSALLPKTSNVRYPHQPNVALHFINRPTVKYRQRTQYERAPLQGTSPDKAYVLAAITPHSIHTS